MKPLDGRTRSASLLREKPSASAPYARWYGRARCGLRTVCGREHRRDSREVHSCRASTGQFGCKFEDSYLRSADVGECRRLVISTARAWRPGSCCVWHGAAIQGVWNENSRMGGEGFKYGCHATWSAVFGKGGKVSVEFARRGGRSLVQFVTTGQWLNFQFG